MDTLTPEERSKLMSKIRGKDTKPELQVRSMLHRAGYRFSLHRKDLPGTPDIVLRKYNTVVFVHGCFWHRHKNCKIASMPKSNVEFWEKKFERNVANDKKHARALRKQGWHVLTVWECELKKPGRVLAKLRKHLTPEGIEENQKPKDYSLKPSSKYPTMEDVEIPMAAEEQVDYMTAKRRKKRES